MNFDAIISDPTFWIAVAFAIFAGFLLWKRIPAMIAKNLDARAEKIKSQLNEARTLKEEAQELLAKFQRKHRDAEKDAKAMMALVRQEAGLFAKEAEKNLEASFQRQIKATEEKITQAEATAVKEVKVAATEAAVKAAGAILDTQLKAGKHKGLIDEAIKDLSKRLN